MHPSDEPIRSLPREAPCNSYENVVAQAPMVGWSKVLALSSWPGVSRPSTLHRRSADGRDTPGHDVVATAAAIFSHRSACIAGWPTPWHSA